MANRMSLIWPVAFGAAAMYLFDPVGGGRRRALVRDKAVWASRKTRDGAAALGSDLQNRIVGLGARMRGLLERGPADDSVLEERVRSVLGRVSSHPGSIAVTASGARVTLSGPILESERAGVIRAINRVKGVQEVVDTLEPHEEPGAVPGLQGGVVRPGQRWITGSWSPTAQFLTALAGIGLVMYGARVRRHAA